MVKLATNLVMWVLGGGQTFLQFFEIDGKALIPTACAFINEACKAMTGNRLEWVCIWCCSWYTETFAHLSQLKCPA